MRKVAHFVIEEINQLSWYSLTSHLTVVNCCFFPAFHSSVFQINFIIFNYLICYIIQNNVILGDDVIIIFYRILSYIIITI